MDLNAKLKEWKAVGFEFHIKHGELDALDDAYFEATKKRINRSCPPCIAAAAKFLYERQNAKAKASAPAKSKAKPKAKESAGK